MKNVEKVEVSWKDSRNDKNNTTQNTEIRVNRSYATMLLDSRRNLEYKVNISEKKERDTARRDRTRNDISKNETNNNGVVDEQADELTEDDKELEQFYQIQIEAMVTAP